MSPDDQEEVDYVKSWRAEYDGARESRNGCGALWLVVAASVSVHVGGSWLAIVCGTFAIWGGGLALALLGHYQGVMHTYYSALKGTRDEPPRDELSARRRR